MGPLPDRTKIDDQIQVDATLVGTSKSAGSLSRGKDGDNTWNHIVQVLLHGTPTIPDEVRNSAFVDPNNRYPPAWSDSPESLGDADLIARAIQGRFDEKDAHWTGFPCLNLGRLVDQVVGVLEGNFAIAVLMRDVYSHQWFNAGAAVYAQGVDIYYSLFHDLVMVEELDRRVAAKIIPFSRRWHGGMFSANPEAVWGM